MAKDQQLWASMVKNTEEIHLQKLNTQQQATALLPSTPLRATAREYRPTPTQSPGQGESEGKGKEEAEADEESNSGSEAAFICSSSGLGSSSGESSSSAEASDASSDGEESEMRRARASAAQEQHTPRACSTRVRRQVARYTPGGKSKARAQLSQVQQKK